MKARLLTQDELDYLKTQINYDNKTGHFSWKVSGKRRTLSDKDIGGLVSVGYKAISIKYKDKYQSYLLARLAYQFEYELITDDTLQIDHRNRIKTDNRISNLKLVTPPENMENRVVKTYGKVKHKYISENIRKNKFKNDMKEYIVTICYNEENKLRFNSNQCKVGSFKTLSDAIIARDCKLKEINQKIK